MKFRRYKRRVYLQGVPLAGFYGLFEEDFGARSPEPYPRVTPSRVGDALLPFRCPSCKGVNNEFIDERKRQQYKDKRPGHNNHWCPMCRARFYFVEDGMPLPAALPARADVGPSNVYQDGKVTLQDSPGIFKRLFGTSNGGLVGLDVLGLDELHNLPGAKRARFR